MHKHLFLTGEKQVGKSTAIRRFLDASWLKTGGFYTVRTNGVFPDTMTVHILRADGSDRPDPDNLLFRCHDKDTYDAAERFDSLGRAALEDYGDAEIVLMDELGPRESNATGFQEAVRRTLRADVPVLGVLQRNGGWFADELLGSHLLYCIDVTKENREFIPERIMDWYRQEWGESSPRNEREDSYGAVVFSRDNKGTYVLMVKSKPGWSFPKGHSLYGEKPEVTAVREIYEETGITARIDNCFRRTVPSIRTNENRSVTFFCGYSDEKYRPPIPLEVADAGWIPLDEAERLIVIESDRETFLLAKEYFERCNAERS